MKRTVVILAAVALVGLGFGIGRWSGNSPKATETHAHEEEAEAEVWTCSMHPQIRQDEPGQCPICGMDLIPVSTEDSGDPTLITMSERALALANIATTVVGYGNSEGEEGLTLTGKVTYDESGLYSQVAHFPGRIEKLLVTNTGEQVRAGQVIARVYSPDILTVQEELKAARVLGQKDLENSVIRKLELWKLSAEEVDAIKSGSLDATQLRLRADASGVIVDRRVNTGDHVMNGTVLYELASLNTVWVEFDVYEQNLSAVKVGNKVRFSVAGLPGESREGIISFVDPVLDPATRTTSARIVVNNSRGKLLPEMLVRGRLEVSGTAAASSLSVPASAVLWTGERSIVYVRDSGSDGTQPGFRLREIVLGPAVGDSYTVIEGLQEGEEVVTAGTFVVDAAAQLQGGKSMMNPDGNSGTPAGHNHGATSDHAGHSSNEHHLSKHGDQTQNSAFTKAETQQLIEEYLELKDALVKSLAKEASSSALKMVEMVPDNTHPELAGQLHQLNQSEDIQAQRAHFLNISETLISMADAAELNQTLYVQFCPMANDNTGGSWLSTEEEIRNPYFGDMMLKCGEVKRTSGT